MHPGSSMLTRFKTFASLYRQQGPRWLAFRLSYAFRLRSGLIRLQMPLYRWADRPLGTWLKNGIPSGPAGYADWRRHNSPKFFFDGQPAPPASAEWDPRSAIREADRILSGEIKYFSNEFQKTGFPPDWHRDPVSGIKMDARKHWSQLSDEGETDIKFVWEASRFEFVYTLVRAYGCTHDEKYAQAFWQLTGSWAASNPPNAGPNWMDGQEMALRLMAWIFGLYAFINSPSTTAQNIADLTTQIAAHAERIYSNTDFAIFTRGNHSISEALGLWLTGLLFPELKDAGKYSSFGRMSLEREAERQIFPDGTYSMYSLNYHRFVLQMYLYAIRLGGISHAPFSQKLQNSISRSIAYLSQLVDPQTGQMPGYGSNDGALVLPLNTCDFNDHRPLLQLGSYITKGRRLFASGAWDEDLFWLCGAEAVRSEVESPQQTAQGCPNGGIYILRGANSKVVIRCTDFTERPSHADQLHVDLWWRGNNIACDAGTYLYSAGGIWHNGLAHTPVHNTVTVDSQDQMKMVSRFTWTNWAKGKVLQHSADLWQGEHAGYKPVIHRRTVHMLAGDRWLVVDHLDAKEAHRYSLHWLLNDVPFVENKNSLRLNYGSGLYEVQTGLMEGQGMFSVVRADPNSTRGWRSRYYGQKQPAISVLLEAEQPEVVFWTFFGFESDAVKLSGDVLRINSLEIKLQAAASRDL